MLRQEALWQMGRWADVGGCSWRGFMTEFSGEPGVAPRTNVRPKGPKGAMAASPGLRHRRYPGKPGEPKCLPQRGNGGQPRVAPKALPWVIGANHLRTPSGFRPGRVGSFMGRSFDASTTPGVFGSSATPMGLTIGCDRNPG